MKRIVTVGLIVVVLLSLSGCALVFKGETQDISVSSDPGGAEVIIDGVPHGITPVIVNLSVNSEHTVVLRKNGQERTFLIRNEVGPLWVVLDVVTGLVPLIVDAATGAWFELKPGQVTATFN